MPSTSPLADPEFVAMRRIIKTLKGLNYGAQQRVLDYARARVTEAWQPLLETASTKWTLTAGQQYNGDAATKG